MAKDTSIPDARNPLAGFFRPQVAGVEDNPDAKMIDIGLLDANPDQPRRHVDPAALEELAASLRAHGVLQALLVRPVGDRYGIVAGERRWRAAGLAGLAQVPCLVRAIADEDLGTLALLENIQRADLDPLDEAHAYRQLMDRAALSLRDLATAVQKSHEYIAGRLRLITDPAVEEAVRSGGLGPTAAGALARLEDPVRRADLLGRVARGERVRVDDVKGVKRAAPPVGQEEGTRPATAASRDAAAAEGLSNYLTGAESEAGHAPPPSVEAPAAQIPAVRSSRGEAPLADSVEHGSSHPIPGRHPAPAEGAMVSARDLLIVQVLHAGQGRAPRAAVLQALRADLKALEARDG